MCRLDESALKLKVDEALAVLAAADEVLTDVDVLIPSAPGERRDANPASRAVGIATGVE